VPQRFHACFTRRIREYEQWKARKLASRYVYAFADGTYFTVIYNEQGCKMPILDGPVERLQGIYAVKWLCWLIELSNRGVCEVWYNLQRAQARSVRQGVGIEG
jgi:transposase-like protein